MHVARLEDAEELFDFYCRHFFYVDPLGTMGAFDVMNSEEVKVLRRDMVGSAVKDGVSLIIRGSNGSVIGAAVNKLTKKRVNSHSDSQDINQRLVWKLVHELNKDIDFFTIGNTDVYVYMYMLAIDDAFRRQGLASELIKGTIELAKENRAGLIKAEFLSSFAYQAAIKFAFKTLRSIDYNKFEYNGTKPLSTCNGLLANHPTGYLAVFVVS